MKTEIDRSAIGRRSQERGSEVQREGARFNCQIWDVDADQHAVWTRRSTAGRSDNIYIDCPGAGFHVELKGEKDLRPHAWIRQTLIDAPDLNCWCQFRRPGILRKLLDEFFYVLVPMPTFTDVRTRGGVDLSLFKVIAQTGRTNWLLKHWIPEVEERFCPAWMIHLELDDEEIEEHDWPRAIALTSARLWAWLLMRAWERTGTTSV